MSLSIASKSVELCNQGKTDVMQTMYARTSYPSKATA